MSFSHVPRMPFGKHAGAPLYALPDRYLDWLAARDGLRPRLRVEVDDEVALRQWTDGADPGEPAGEPPTTCERIAGALVSSVLEVSLAASYASDLAMQLWSDHCRARGMPQVVLGHLPGRALLTLNPPAGEVLTPRGIQLTGAALAGTRLPVATGAITQRGGHCWISPGEAGIARMLFDLVQDHAVHGTARIPLDCEVSP